MTDPMFGEIEHLPAQPWPGRIEGWRVTCTVCGLVITSSMITSISLEMTDHWRWHWRGDTNVRQQATAERSR